jgi:O-antigen ligase
MRRLQSVLFLATVFSVTFEKLHWNVAGAVGLADVLAIAFLLAFVSAATTRVPRTTAVVAGFLAAFLLVYLIGFFNLDTQDALAQFAKGMVKFLIHFAFLAAAVTFIAQRGERYFWRSLAWFCSGMVANAAYGVAQLLVARAGGNLDARLLSPLTGGASQINVYGAVGGASVYRPNAMTGDPNHLAIMLIVPLLVLAPIYLRLERGHRLRLPLGAVLGFLLLVELATLSRSGLLGLGVGALLLAVPYRTRLLSRELLLLIGGVAVVLTPVVLSRLHYFEVVFHARTQTGGSSSSVHFDVYSFVPDVLHQHPLFGLGLNNFSVYYEFVTGKTNWGPHSFYVAQIVETGLVGSALFAAFVWFLFRRLRSAREIGRALAAAHDGAAARVRPLAWGLTAALLGTLASNVFYLTMQFYYFYAFAALCLAAPLVFGRRLRPASA